MGSRAYAAFTLILAAGLLSACVEENVRRPDVLVITIDTLRADGLGAYNPGVTTTPALDTLAAEGTVFDRAYAPMPLTRPSHLTMLTSLFPREHGVLNNAMSLPEATPSVTQRFADAGYRTGAFVGVRLLGPDSGADRGFEHYDYPTQAQERTAETVVRQALDWIGGLAGDESYFVWLHLFDPHLPYGPPGSEEELSWPILEEIAAANGGDAPAEVLAKGKALYADEIAYVDRQIGHLLERIDALRDLERTVVVFTADHGECFENGIFFEHADCLFEPGIRIPLIVRYPEMFEAGARVAGTAGIIDVAPTVLQAAGLAVPESYSGRALQRANLEQRRLLIQYPFFQQRAAQNRPRMRQVMRSVAGEPTREILVGRERVGLVGEAWKYLRDGESEELFPMDPEPQERENRAAAAPAVVRELGLALDAALERHPLTLIAPGEINEELLETLKALGYLQ